MVDVNLKNLFFVSQYVALEASLFGQRFGQSFSVGHYPPIYQPPERIYLLNILRAKKKRNLLFLW